MMGRNLLIVVNLKTYGPCVSESVFLCQACLCQTISVILVDTILKTMVEYIGECTSLFTY
jgi:hypothetical protein